MRWCSSSSSSLLKKTCLTKRHALGFMSGFFFSFTVIESSGKHLNRKGEKERTKERDRDSQKGNEKKIIFIFYFIFFYIFHLQFSKTFVRFKVIH